MCPPMGLNRYPIPGSTAFLRPSCRNHPSWCRTINLLPITYAFLPRLRDRLTLGRLTLPRNPWAYGEQVSHLFYRYSILHKLFSQLQPSLPLTFAVERMLAYHWKLDRSPKPIRSFGTMLEPRYIFGAGSLDQ